MPKIPRRLLRRRWVRRAVPAGVVAVLVVAGAVVTRANANASPIDTYRTTTVTTGSVEQRLNVTGSVQRVNQVSESFPVAGTVSSVSVSVGDAVTAGQTLATLDPVPLRSAVTAAEASLAKAEATLESDQSAASTGTTATSASGNTSGNNNLTPAATAPQTTSPRVTSPSGRSAAGTNQSLAATQKRATAAQRAITADLKSASAALAQCVAFFPSQTSGLTPAASGTARTTTTRGFSSTLTATPSGTAPTTTPLMPAPSGAAITACLGALRTAPTQQRIQRDQQALTRSQADLTTAITRAVTTTGTTANTSGTTSSAAGSQSSTSRSSASQSSSGQSSGAGQSSAARVVADQGAVTKAKAALSSAQADLASATLKSSISGKVGSVGLVNGTSGQGKSVVIVGAGAVEVTVNVPLASIATIHVGQQANVTPQGATSFVPGAVTSISLLPSSSTSSTATGNGAGTQQATGSGQGTTTASSPAYPVVVLVPGTLLALASGSRAEVSLLIGNASHVLTVPNSALTPLAKGQALALTFKGVGRRAASGSKTCMPERSPPR